MLQNRIQKLLCNEYNDFNDLVIIESPFAQTTRDGNGIRQLQIGISPNKLIMACDNPCLDAEPWNCGDPETESLELLSIVPLESVTLTVFRRRTRNTIKAHFSNGRILFFELAVRNRREMFWNLWCDRMRLLSPELISSTQSETSVGSSSSTVTNYARTLQFDKAWHERDLFLGSKFGTWPIKKKRQPVGSPHVPREAEALPNKSGKLKVCQVNRFGAGISENCSTSLFLPAQVIVAQSFLEDINGFFKGEEEEEKWPDMFMDGRQRSRIVQHPRRYGLQAMPHLIAGLGLWALPNPQARLAQMRRWCSEVSLSTREASTSTTIPKSLLKSSVSSESLLRYSKQYEPAVLFWTPGFWYKPRNLPEAYLEQRHHLSDIQFSISHGTIKKKRWLKLFKKKQAHNVDWKYGCMVKKKQDFRSLLVADIALSSWDFDSTLIAYQITLIDKDLFIRIPASDFEALLKERNARNAPNFRAFVAFSNRLANLITTEVIRIDSVKLHDGLTWRTNYSGCRICKESVVFWQGCKVRVSTDSLVPGLIFAIITTQSIGG
ncbi:uncharacterized protein [Halyomorpha halys]|uniref:uncharacterized protein isoform X2 n=1 Tax=Halyomorpha halys TaxID=286706 RepID=UPI0006D515A3|nr:uncharacterized protein LOC106687097 isoform X2 [Halyomorpha halys]